MDFINNRMLREIDIVQKRTEEMIKEFFGDAYSKHSHEYWTWSPAVDIYETDENIIILVELAGVRREDVSVILDRNTICIAGKRMASNIIQKKIRQHQMEISFGTFKRIFRISVPIKDEEVEATFQDGFLTIKMPKQVPVSVKIDAKE